jgi:hypothetical protein
LRIEVVAAFPPTTDDNYQVCADEEVEVLGNGLAGHGNPFA